MSETKKSILAETLEGIQSVQQQIEENANFALSTTLKDELSEIIKKGLTESFSPEDETTPQDIAVDAADTTPTENPLGLDDATADTEESDVINLDTPGEEEDEVVDLTGASAEEVIGSFKLMSPSDEIEIVRSENGIEIKFSTEGDANSIASAIPAETPGAELPGEEMGTETPGAELPGEEIPGEEAPVDGVPSEDEEELYEIEITEEDEEVVEETVDAEPTVTEEDDKEDVKESHNKLVASRKKVQALMLENKRIKNELVSVDENFKAIKKAEGEYKQSIVALKKQLTEVALFTSNNIYAIKLMTENTTTKDEKLKILKRLDAAKTITESREVFTSLSESFNGVKNTTSQLIESKILNSDKTSAASKLNETVVYSNPQVDRIKEIMYAKKK